MRITGVIQPGSDPYDEVISALNEAGAMHNQRPLQQLGQTAPESHNWLESLSNDHIDRVKTFPTAASGTDPSREFAVRMLTIEILSQLVLVRWLVIIRHSFANALEAIRPPIMGLREDSLPAAELVATTWKRRVENSEFIVPRVSVDDRQCPQIAFDFVRLSNRVGIGLHIFGPIGVGARRLVCRIADYHISEELFL